MPWASGDSLSPSILNLRAGEATLATGFSTDTLRAQSLQTVEVFSDLSVGRLSVRTELEVNQRIEIGGVPSSNSGLLSLRAASNQTDFILFEDSLGIRSSYLLGQRTGDTSGITDGLNLYDISGDTMIVRFSRNSCRFYSAIVGPEFCVFGVNIIVPTEAVLTLNQPADQGGLVINQNGNMASSGLLIQGGGVEFDSRAPLVNLLQTWNSSNISLLGIKFNVTNNASHASSRLLDLEVNGGDKFVVGVGGEIASASSHPKVTITQGTFASPFDTAVYIAPEPKSNWTIDSEGLYIQHRLSGSGNTTGSPAHDALAADLSISASQYTKGTGNAIEASVIVGGVNSTASDLRSITANMTANSGTTGVLTSLSIIRAQTAVNNSVASYSIGTVVGIWAEQQTVGSTNLNIYAPGGLSRFGSLIVEQTTGTPFTVASGAAGDGQNAYSVLDGIRIGGEDRLNTIYNSSRSIGITADSGATIFLGQTSSTVSGLAISTTSGDVKFNSGASININQARLLSVRTAASLDSTTLSTNEMAFQIVAGSVATLAIRSGGTIYYFASSASTKG